MPGAKTSFRIGIVAGETSGDMLGAGLMRALKQRLPTLSFEGVGGPRMQAEGCRSLYPMERLSIIGFAALRKYPGLIRMRRRLAEHFMADPPDVFIGIDAPDFCLGLEERLRAAGIKTVHYVSPTVWAWRGYRIRQIKRAVDHMLVLFPFEARYYEEHQVPVTFVGHPLADQVPDRWDRPALRRKLNLPEQATVVALLPGSRSSELHYHAELFVESARQLHAARPDLQFVAPLVDDISRARFLAALGRHGADLPVTTLVGSAREALAAADVALVASGTATLEAALLCTPMVVTYRLSRLSYLLARLFVRVKHYSLPNILAGRMVVPEFMQHDATPEKLARALEFYLSHPAETQALIRVLAEMRQELHRNADNRAADAVAALLRSAEQDRQRAGAVRVA